MVLAAITTYFSRDIAKAPIGPGQPIAHIFDAAPFTDDIVGDLSMDISLTSTATRVPIIFPTKRSYSQSKRRNAIRRYRILDSAPEAAFDSIAMLVAKICDTRSAAISFIDDHRQWFKATYGIDSRETPICAAFCAHTVEQSTILVVKDALVDPRFIANSLVTANPWIRFYAGMRILAADGTPIASLCVFDPRPRQQGLTKVEATTLRALAAQVQSLLELRRSIIERDAQAAAQIELSKALQHVAEHDPLTGLPHRGVFQQHLNAAMRDADRARTRLAVMLVDVDHFKQINDTLGHDVGDAVLCSFAKRLCGIMRKTDLVARLGGDEFGVVLTGIERQEDIEAVIQSLNDRLQRPMKHRGRLVDCQASIGLTLYPDHGRTAEALTKCGDLALAEAKRTRGCVATFNPSMASEFERETRMLSIARKGIVGQHLVPYYQPKVDLTSGKLVGFEALVRCDRIGQSPILPEMFEIAFQDRNLARAIGEQMLTSVLDNVRAWVNDGFAFGNVAINSCAADFTADDFAERLLSALASRDLDVGVIELEVTEGVFLGRGAHHVKRALSVLSNQGMRIALDDFGTGYASLTHLKQFPVDVLKIDRSFVSGIGKNPDDTAIVRALIGLGTSLGIATVAEGIETCAQADFVKMLGCDTGQGYLYGKAMPAELVPTLVAHFNDHPAAAQETATFSGGSR